MTENNLKKAQEIQSKIKYMSHELRFFENELSFENFMTINHVSKDVVESFRVAGLESIKNQMEELKKEFENI